MTSPISDTREAFPPTEVLDFLVEEGVRPKGDEVGHLDFKFKSGTSGPVRAQVNHADCALDSRTTQPNASGHTSASIQAYLPDVDGWRGGLLRTFSPPRASVQTFASRCAQLEN